MILSALYELARREHLIDDPNYEPRPISYLLRVDDGGRFLALVPTLDERTRPKAVLVPKQGTRSSGVKAFFLVDNAKYVLGSDGERDPERSQKCVEAFARRVHEAVEATGDEGILAVARFFEKHAAEAPKALAEGPTDGWTGSEVIAFVRDADGTLLVHERPAVRDYWAGLRANDLGEAAAVRCLVTGQVSPPTRLHDKVKRVPGAQTSGAAIVSFNDEAFTSHGLEAGENAPISRAAAEGYVKGLNWLLAGTATRRHRQGVRIADGAVAVFWTKTAHPVSDLLASLFEPDAEEAASTVVAPLRGLEPSNDDLTPFYALSLSGAGGRVMVRDWIDTTAEKIKRNVRRFFDDLRIGGMPRDEPIPLWRLLTAIEPPGGGLPPDLGGRLFRSALTGGPFPSELFGAALRRLRLPPPKGARIDPALPLRCALIKAMLCRLPGSPMEVSVSLDPENFETPYLLGRLFAVLERIQGTALKDLNATIRDRYFGSASTTPAVVFPRLLRLSVHHVAKAGTAGWLEKLKSEIVGHLPAERFPRFMTLEDQGLFAIGYYHQREDFFRKKEKLDQGAAAAA